MSGIMHNILSASAAAAAASSYWINTFNLAVFLDTSIDTTGAVYSAGGVRLIKYSASGSVVYQVSMSPNVSFVIGDGVGNCYVLDNTTSYAILKIDSSGVVTFSRTYSEANAPPTFQYKSLFFDTAGAVFALWATSLGTANVTKITTAGALTWQKSINIPTSAAATVPIGGGADASNNVYFACYGTDYSSQIFTVAKFNSVGTLQWQRDIQEATSGISSIFSVADSAGNVYVSSTTRICKLNTSGTLQWQREISSPFGALIIYCAVADGTTGDIYVGGLVSTGFVVWGYVAKINSAGTLQWARVINKNVPAFNDYQVLGISLQGSSTLSLLMYGGGVGTSVTIKIPSDGSKTGTYGSYQITADTSTMTVITAFTVVVGASTIATPAGTLDVTAETTTTSAITNTLTAIP
jgi:hypothetical protein